MEKDEVPGEEDLPIPLHRQARNEVVRFGIEAAVHGAVGIQAGNVGSGGGRFSAVRLERGKAAADQDPAVRLQRDAADLVVGIGIEAGVDRTVGIQAGDPVAHGGHKRTVGLELAERAADHDFPVGLERDAGNVPVGTGIKAGVQRAVGIQPGDTFPDDRHNRSVGLERVKGTSE